MVFFTVITTSIYKTCLLIGIHTVFIPIDSWHKLMNIGLLTQFCSLMIYLARIPKEYKGYLVGIGMCLIMMMQEKDAFSFKYALIPVIFNNLLLVCSGCVLGGPIYVNSRCAALGAFWYIFSIVFFIGSYFRAIDLFYLFDDAFMIATAFSLYYSW